MDSVLLSHNGLGDNLLMIGGIHYLLKFYNRIYFLCKNKYYQHVKSFFDEKINVICIPFNENNELFETRQLIMKYYLDSNIDIFIAGDCHKSHLSNKITNKLFLENKIEDNHYNIDFDDITTENYCFIENFYKDIKLNLKYFFDYFYLPSTEESFNLYKSISNYYIVFIQLKSSDNKYLNISNLITKYLLNDNVILICNDKNLYDIDNKTENIKIKYNLCEKFVYNKIINYNDTIKNSDEIYIIDSCFTGIVLPYLKTNKLKANKVRIILRNNVDKIIL